MRIEAQSMEGLDGCRIVDSINSSGAAGVRGPEQRAARSPDAGSHGGELIFQLNAAEITVKNKKEYLDIPA